MSLLVNKQRDFLLDISRLILWTHDYCWPGHDEVFFTAGDFYATSGHMPGSLHGSRLAADLNLFVNGRYIRTAHPHWFTIGDKWKSLHPDNRWGGDFSSPEYGPVRDFNHFSRTHNGKA